MSQKSERQRTILSLLEHAPGMSIQHLTMETNCSEMTIRRDLKELQQKEYVSLINGVAILRKNQDGSSIPKDYSLFGERSLMQDAKSRIGALACSLLQPGDSIIVDTGTTTEQLFAHLPEDFPLTVMCYNLNTLLACASRENIDIIFPGGFYHRNTQMFESSESAKLFSRICADKFFASAAGISQKGMVTCAEQHELSSKQHAINAASTRILLADSSKFGKIRPCMFATLDEFDMVITDASISEEWLTFFEKNSIKYLLA